MSTKSCWTCLEGFSSRNKLFAHLRATGHDSGTSACHQHNAESTCYGCGIPLKPWTMQSVNGRPYCHRATSPHMCVQAISGWDPEPGTIYEGHSIPFQFGDVITDIDPSDTFIDIACIDYYTGTLNGRTGGVVTTLVVPIDPGDVKHAVRWQRGRKPFRGRAQVKQTYNSADRQRSIDVRPGEFVSVLDSNAPVWWRVKNSAGREGIIPCKYLSSISTNVKATLQNRNQRVPPSVSSSPSIPSPAPSSIPAPAPSSVPDPAPSSPQLASTGIGKTLVRDISANEIIKEAELGRGGLGEVYAGKWNHEEVAVKEAHMLTGNEAAELMREAAAMRELTSPNIVTLYGVTMQQQPGGTSTAMLVMELMRGGSLHSLLHDRSDLPWVRRIQIARDMGRGLRYMHQMDFLHRDIKSGNVLLSEYGRAKLADFGFARLKQSLSARSTKHQSAGTPVWMAPELFKRRAKYNKACDVYSFGMTLWEVAARAQPFAEAASRDIAMQWVRDGEKEEIPEGTPAHFGSLIERCWSTDPAARPSMVEVVETLEAMRM